MENAPAALASPLPPGSRLCSARVSLHPGLSGTVGIVPCPPRGAPGGSPLPRELSSSSRALHDVTPRWTHIVTSAREALTFFSLPPGSFIALGGPPGCYLGSQSPHSAPFTVIRFLRASADTGFLSRGPYGVQPELQFGRDSCPFHRSSPRAPSNVSAPRRSTGASS